MAKDIIDNNIDIESLMTPYQLDEYEKLKSTRGNEDDEILYQVVRESRSDLYAEPMLLENTPISIMKIEMGRMIAIAVLAGDKTDKQQSKQDSADMMATNLEKEGRMSGASKDSKRSDIGGLPFGGANTGSGENPNPFGPGGENPGSSDDNVGGNKFMTDENIPMPCLSAECNIHINPNLIPSEFQSLSLDVSCKFDPGEDRCKTDVNGNCPSGFFP